MMEQKDKKLFLSLVIWALVPSIYMLIRMHIISVNSVDINILGNLEWFDLIDEVIVTTLTVPLYCLLKPGKSSKEKNGAAFLLSFGIYMVFALVIAASVGSIAKYMNAENAKQYLFLQTFAMLASYVSTFCVLILTLNDGYRVIHILLIIKIAMMAVSDFFLIQAFADLGAAYSEILVNAVISAASLIFVVRNKYLSLRKADLRGWTQDYARIGAFAGLQIFLDNFIYAIMICKMVNAVAETGNYWIANNFIWGWLLVPVSCFAEIIKKNSYEKLDWKNAGKYALYIVIGWGLTIPAWRWFLENCMSVSNTDAVLGILYSVMPFYIAYLASAFLDAWFTSRGRTEYLMLTSVVVNIVYYGIVYLIFNTGKIEPSISFICAMFGFGMVVHCIMSAIFVVVEKRRKMIA